MTKNSETEKSSRVTLRWIGLLSGSAALLFVLGVVLYAIRVNASARELIDSASNIRSTADAEREIAAWRNRSGRDFWESTSPNDGDHSYDIHVDNGLLHRLRVAPPTAVGMTITMRNSQLRYVTLIMFTGRDPSKTAGVWIQEWFGSGTANDFRVNTKDRPSKATLEFSSAISDSQREKAFALNAGCVVRLAGCRSAEDILPNVWGWGSQEGQ
jgi:hypothetical protein